MFSILQNFKSTLNINKKMLLRTSNHSNYKQIFELIAEIIVSRINYFVIFVAFFQNQL